MTALVVLILLFSAITARCELRSIGPVATCYGEVKTISEALTGCYTKCPHDEIPSSSMTMTIYQVIAPDSGPKVVECSKHKMTQTFTQTWTFSTLKTTPVIERLTPTKEECNKLIKDKCPTLDDCHEGEPDEIPEEYHYGSDTTKSNEYLSLRTIPSSIMYDDGKLKISPVTTDEFFVSSEKSGTSKKSIYQWNEKPAHTTCPFSEVATYPCDSYTGYYICAGGRFTLTPKSGTKDITSLCTGMHESVEGMLYKATTPTDAEKETSGRLFLSTAGKTASTDVSFLKTKVQHISVHLDADLCQSQCEIASLESRMPKYRDDPLIRVGNNYMRVLNRSHIQECKTLHGCQLAKPHLFCGNPPRLGVVCTGTGGLWDPMEPYLEVGESCLNPDTMEKLSVTMGHMEYVVDDDLMVNVSRNYSHGIQNTMFSNKHQKGLHLTPEDWKAVKQGWSAEKSKAKKGNVVASSDEIKSPHINLGGYIMKTYNKAVKMFSSAEAVIGVVVILGATVVTVTFASKLISMMPSYNKKKGFALVKTKPDTVWA